jgi:hypothetical protein
MAKQSRPPPEEFRPLSELGEATRKQILNDWNKRHEGRPPPTEQELRNLSVFLTDNLELIEGAYAYYIYLALKCLVNKIPHRPFRPKVMAALVDMLLDAGVPLADARREIAQRSRKTVEAVKQAHLRYGKRTRDKSQ